MRKFLQNKLWRDKLIEKMETNHGSRIHWHHLDVTEFDQQLRIKLIEETQEVVATKDRVELIAELADVYEVIDTLANLHQITKDEIVAAQTHKRNERGGFASRRFVEVAEHPIGSFGEQYCLADPEKYPEIVECYLKRNYIEEGFHWPLFFIITLSVGYILLQKTAPNNITPGTIIILNGPSGSGKSSIQKAFQKIMMPNLWVKVGIDNLFDNVMPDITPENMQFWQSENPIRWVQTSQDAEGNNIITLLTGPQGERVAYAMNSAIAAYAQSGCNVIVDYIAYNQNWLKDLEQKCKPFTTYYVAVEIPLATLEQREEARGTSPKGHARSHYATVYGDKKYDLVVNSGKHSAQEIAQQLKQLVENNIPNQT